MQPQALLSVDEGAAEKAHLESAFSFITKRVKDRSRITSLLPHIVSAQLGESGASEMVINACNQVSMKVRQEQLDADIKAKETTMACATNLDTLQKTEVSQAREHDEVGKRIKASHEAVGTAVIPPAVCARGAERCVSLCS